MGSGLVLELAQVSFTCIGNCMLPWQKLNFEQLDIKHNSNNQNQPTIMRKSFYSIVVVVLSALSFTVLSCKNSPKEAATPNTAQSDSTAVDTAAVDTAATTPEETAEETVTPGDRPTFQLVGNVKSCKLKNADNNGKTTTYVFDEQGKLKTIDGRKEEITRNKKGQITGYSIGEYGLSGYTFAYDAQGRMKSRHSPMPTLAVMTTVTSTTPRALSLLATARARSVTAWAMKIHRPTRRM